MKSISIIQALTIPEQDLRFLQLLNQYNVQYLVIGGYAVRYHGYLRPVKDLDVLVNCFAEHTERLRLCDAVAQLIGRRLAFTAEDLERPQQQLCLKDHGYCIDVLTSIEGLKFDNAYRQRIIVNVASIPITIISQQHLLESKRISLKKRAKRGREQDLKDIRYLENE